MCIVGMSCEFGAFQQEISITYPSVHKCSFADYLYLYL